MGTVLFVFEHNGDGRMCENGPVVNKETTEKPPK